MPELHKLYAGDEINLDRYPHLKQIIQLGQTTIRGTLKFRDSMVYVNPKQAVLEIPENRSNDTVFECYKDGKKVSDISSEDLTRKADQLYSQHLDTKDKTPLFMSLNLETPLALSLFLGCNTNKRKVFIPSTFNMSKIMNDIELQGSSTVVCDAELYNLQPPKANVHQL